MPLPGADAQMEMKFIPVATVRSWLNKKFEIRSSKLETITESSRRNARSRLVLLRFRFDHFHNLLVRICFGFRYSNFELSGTRSFTLIELLVVIAIIAVLIGLAFPVFQGVQNQARKTQAKNDLVQIVTAISAYYTEYGKYPFTPATPADTTYGATTANAQLFNELRNVAATQNPRGIVFLSPPDVKDPSNPRAGINSAAATAGQYFDPWGKPYLIRIDTDYDNQVGNPYSQNAGGAPLLRTAVIAWSFGKDALSQSTSATPWDKNAGTNKDDVISWQ
jgi:prepilin-type N-terminal cleavage/methylation domain-containing protein